MADTTAAIRRIDDTVNAARNHLRLKVPSDALVFFGATGDLAHKKIFPALQAMIKRGNLNVPVIGVAKAGWTIEQLRERARDGIATFGGGVDEAAFAKLVQLLKYIDGDYQDPETFKQLRSVLGNAKHPTHYLAIPPSLFATVVEALGKSGCADGRARHHREALWPRPGLGAAAECDSAIRVPRIRNFSHRSLSRQGSGGKFAVVPVRECVSRADLESQLRS